ncbi:cyanophycinase [Bremerella alba]|uniref:Cyanophycinase n=1 Tax=Bremerella alba TaxID=980252 RepID=A0A7V8V290_9BACT|nr:cyanophycinase [Bremerella alba]MBA2113551.1 hypothetical protein [Bremerella alba]
MVCLKSITCVAFILAMTAVASAQSEESADGHLIVVGGGRLTDQIISRFVELAGGSEARLIVIPTASGSPDSDQTIIDRWKKRGIADVQVLHTSKRDEANSDVFVAPLKEATAVWISGGLQSRLAKAYEGTRVEQELKALVHRGCVVGGTSAGAAIQSPVMIAGSYPIPRMEQGFDLLPGVIIDQHFLARNRMNRLLYAVGKHPDQIGVGIDESTAIEVHGNRCRVLGESTVTVILGTGINKPLNILTYQDGEKFTIGNAESPAPMSP